MRGEGGVAGKGRVVGIPKFHSWGKCTMPLTNINSNWMSNASSGLCINLFIYVIEHNAPQDAHKRLVLQVYFGLHTSEFSAKLLLVSLK